MKIVLCTDDNYAHEAVKCISYINKTQKKCDVVVLGHKLSHKSRSLFKDVTVVDFQHDSELGPRFRPNFMKLYIPEYCADDKVIYLDTDTITLRRLQPLWDIDISNYYAACAKNIVTPRAVNAKHYLDFKVECDTLLANLGVMVLNCDKWRADDITSRLIIFTNEVIDSLNQTYTDNIALARIQKEEFSFNSVLKDKWLEIDEKWNVIPLSKNKKPYIIHTWHDPSSIYK